MAQEKNTQLATVLYMAFDLGSTKWLTVSGTKEGTKTRRRAVPAGDLAAVSAEFVRAKQLLNLAADAPVVTCYEAGRDGFWLHRWLESEGVRNVVVDSSSIEVNRRYRRVKTDRIDATKLLDMLIRYVDGDKRVWQVNHVPDEVSEDERRYAREIDRLKKERGAHWVRIQSLLCLHGIRLSDRSAPKLDELRSPEGKALLPTLKTEIRHEWERLQLCEKQFRELEQRQKKLFRESDSPAAKRVRKLTRLRGVGSRSSWLVVLEFFAWRKFKNRRQLGALAGMVGTHYRSDSIEREQGISKAGNKRVRAMMVELAWLWLRWQPRSALSLWFQRRFGHGSRRMRRVGIVALARKLLIAFWRYLEEDKLPEGAVPGRFRA